MRMKAEGNRAVGRGMVVLALSIAVLSTQLFGAQITTYKKIRPEKGHLIQAVPYEKWLAINYCGPACLSMVMNYWAPERRIGQKAIAASVYDVVQQATFNSDMVLYPMSQGLASYSFQGDLDTLRAILRKDIPVIVLTRSLKQIGKGHYRVVIGFDETEGKIIFHDPLFGSRKAMKVRTFMRIWNLGGGRNQSRWMMAVVPVEAEFPFPALREHPLTHINLATAYYRSGDLERSKREWETARELSNGDPFPLTSLGMISLREGRADDAAAYALEALKLDAKSAYGEDVLGLALAWQGRIVEALGALGRAVRLAPKEKFIRDHYLQVRTLYIEKAGAGRKEVKGGPR